MIKARSVLKRAFVVALSCALISGNVVPAVVGAAGKSKVKEAESETIIVTGKRYSISNKNAKSFKSSNKKIATVTKDGKIIPKKTGYVIISAVINGKSVKNKFLCVSKTGSTSSQSKIDKMLNSKNVDTITIKNAKKKATYTIDKGDYSDKKLVVDAPLSDVKNSGMFSKILIKDVKAGTFTNSATNRVSITDKNFSYVEKAKGSTITTGSKSKGSIKLAGKNTNIISKGTLNLTTTKKGTLNTVTIDGGTFVLDASNAPAIDQIKVTKKSTIRIEGKTDAKIPITIEKMAADTTLDTNCSLSLTVNANAMINLSEKVAGSVINVSKEVKAEIHVDNSVLGSIQVTAGDNGQVKKITGGSNLEVIRGMMFETGSGGGGGAGGGGGGGTVVTQKPSISTEYSKTKNETVYTLKDATGFDALSEINLTVKTVNRTENLKVTGSLLSDLKDLVEDESNLVERYKKLTSEVTKSYETGITAKIVTPDASNPGRKLVTFTAPSNTSIHNKTFEVVLTEGTGSDQVTIQRYENGAYVTGAKKIVMTKSGNSIYIDINNGSSSYKVTTDSAHTYFSISGDTTSKVIINSVS